MAPANITAHPPSSPTAGKIRLGAASPATQPSTPETLAALDRIAQQASSQKIDILLLPEAYIGGYPRGTHFGCTIGARTQEGRDEYLSYFKNAVDLGDIVGEGGAGGGEAWVRRELPEDAAAAVVVVGESGESGVEGEKTRPKRGDGTREELERIARQTGVFLVVGCIEKSGGSMYCSAVYVCPSRGIIGKRRKVMPVSLPVSQFPLAHVEKVPILTNLEYDIDRNRTSSLGPGIAGNPPRSEHHHPGHPYQHGRCNLLGELHALAAAVPIRPEYQPVPGADGRWEGYLACAAQNHWD